MRLSNPTLPVLATLALTVSTLAAQEHEAEGQHDMQARHALMGDLQIDVGTVRDKLIGLANAIPADKWDWRPGEGVRSVQEVFMHVAADNYFLPAPMGVPTPASTGIQADDFATVQAYEGRALDRSETIEALTVSFEHILSAMGEASPMSLSEDVDAGIFSQEFTHQGLWVAATTHLHEHLGQMIAYARTNGVVPPWSR